MEISCPKCRSAIISHFDQSDATITHCPQCGEQLLAGAALAKREGKTVVGVADYDQDPTLAYQPPNEESRHESGVPERLGRYRILSLLGSGGFANVYLAFDEELHRKVAVKVPRRDRFLSDEEYEHFFEEARVLAQFEHEGIVPVHDVGTVGDVKFIVTRFIDGASLSSRLRQGKISFAEAARIVSECSDAIHAAHKRQIYHRDLKPGNILLTSEGKALVADFGLAISRERMQPSSREFSGTPRYMSPEQVRGDLSRLDGRSDIWSLGVLLYRMLTGTEPFICGGRLLAVEILENDPVPLRQHNENIPAELEAICLKCLAKLPGSRYQTAFDLGRDLQSWLSSNSDQKLTSSCNSSNHTVESEDTSKGFSKPTLGSAAAGTPVVKSRLLAAAGFCSFIATLAIVGFGFGSRRTESDPTRSPIATEKDFAAVSLIPVPGKWSQLLAKEPQKLIFPSVGPARMFYEPLREELSLLTPEAGYVSLLDTKESDYRFSVRLHRSNWIGDAGLFFGYRPLRWNDGRVLDQCLAIYICGVQLPNGKAAYSIRLERLIVTPSNHVHDDVSPGHLLSREIKPPLGSDHLLEVLVVNNQMNKVLWDGETIYNPQDRSDQEWMQGLPDITGEGRLGVFSRLGDTIFSDARILITRQPPSKKELEP